MDVRDVIVVGGGPAGAASAAFLARAGFDVLLLDRARFPRDKPCGEFLTPETKRLFRALGVWESVLAAGAVPVRRVELHGPGGARADYTPTEGEPAGWAIRRRVLDAVLLDHARACGAEVREGVAVRELARDSGCSGVQVFGCSGASRTPEYRARLILGADGTHSLVARRLGLVRPIRRLQRVAIVSHWRGLEDAEAIEMRSRGGTVCGLGALGGGQANLTLVVPTTDAARIAGRAGEFLEERVAERFPDLAARLAGAEREETVRTVGCFGHVCRRASADGALLVGDAAAFIDPFTGEGIYFALRGAELAAEVAADALRAGDTSAARLAAYDRARKELTRRYLLCGFVQAVVRTPALMDRAARRLASSPALTGCLMRVLGDLRPPSDALNVGFLWSLFASRTAKAFKHEDDSPQRRRERGEVSQGFWCRHRRNRSL